MERGRSKTLPALATSTTSNITTSNAPVESTRIIQEQLRELLLVLQDKFGQAVESQAILQQELMVYSQVVQDMQRVVLDSTNFESSIVKLEPLRRRLGLVNKVLESVADRLNLLCYEMERIRRKREERKSGGSSGAVEAFTRLGNQTSVLLIPEELTTTAEETDQPE